MRGWEHMREKEQRLSLRTGVVTSFHVTMYLVVINDLRIGNMCC
jgi:hypothetical protein